MTAPDPPLRSPADFSGGLPEIDVLEWESPLYRIQDSECLSYRTYPGPRHRFDAPSGQYATIYTNDTEHGPFAEAYADFDRYIGREHAGRHLLKITPTRPLLLADLRSTATRSALEIDARISASTGDVYRICQEWGQAFYQEWHDVSGVRYAPRKADENSSNVVLFADRCEPYITCTSLGQLKSLEQTVLYAADKYNLTAEFLIPPSFSLQNL